MDGLSKPQVTAQPAPAPAPTAPADPAPAKVGEKTNVDMYLSYSLDHDVPFIADYYGIGNMLNYKDLDYKSEVDAIDEYLIDEVKGKRLDNTTEAVKARMSQLEKVAGIDPNMPVSIRVKKLAAYAKYMKAMSDIDQSVVF